MINETLIQIKGDRALFGNSRSAMKTDFVPTIILKAKDFAAEITSFNAREHGMHTVAAISTEHITNNKVVRNTLIERGIRPESLFPSEDVKKVERRLASEEKKSLKNPDGLSESAESEVDAHDR